MTKAELCAELRVKESYLTARWQDVIKFKAREGIKLMKVGRGKDASYGIKYPWDKEFRFNPRDERARMKAILDKIGVDYIEDYIAEGHYHFDFYLVDMDIVMDYRGKWSEKKEWCEENGCEYFNVPVYELIEIDYFKENLGLE